ncbi:MAG: undecaprenyldiphospho-muramoylpentapeptide beta-N-acetylglucosaminyltransferase [Mariprofundaceae bacterium]
MKPTPQLCIAGGGTGGHVMPALALADAARQQWPELKVSFIGAERGLEAKLLPERNEQVLLLSMHAIQGKGWLGKLRVLCWEIPSAVLKIRKHWKASPPTLLVGVGGYASATGVIAALISRVPVVLYEQNAVPGLVNRSLARFCKLVMLGFNEAAAHISTAHCVHTGNIVRSSITQARWQQHQPPCLLVLGGSQGARFLNESIPEACQALKQQGLAFKIKHICGADQEQKQRLEKLYQQVGIDAEVMCFCDDMSSFYQQGDLMIARSGAMTVSEAAMVGMPCIFVPLPHAADQHQFFNAQSLVKNSAALIFKQQSNAITALTEILKNTLFNPNTLLEMHHNARHWSCDDATQRQLKVLSGWLQGGPS